MSKDKKSKKKVVLIILAAVVGAALAASITILVIVLIQKNTFVKTDGIKVTIKSAIASDCRQAALVDSLDFWTRQDVIIDPTPPDEEWMKESVKENEIYTKNGYPTFSYTWYGKYENTPVKYECLIETGKEYTGIVYLKSLSTKIIDKGVDLYDKNGNRIESD